MTSRGLAGERQGGKSSEPDRSGFLSAWVDRRETSAEAKSLAEADSQEGIIKLEIRKHKMQKWGNRKVKKRERKRGR